MRRIGSWILIIVGLLALALFAATFITVDDKSDWPGFVILSVFALALVALGLRVRRGPRPRKVAAPSERLTDAYAHLRAGEPVVLAPSRKRWAGVLLICALFAGVCVAWMVDEPNVIAALGVLLFGPCTLIAVAQLIPGRAYLRIAPDGLVIRTPFKTTRWAWNDIENFQAYEISQRYTSSKHVGFDRRDLTPARQGFWKTLNRGISGVDVGLPDTYGVRHTELADLLDAARDRYATEHGLSASALADRQLAEEAAHVRRDRVPAVTALLAAACVALFAVEVARYGPFPNALELLDMGAASRDALADGHWWTLLSANVLHADPIHLLFNMIGFVIIGVLLEREVGWARFAGVCAVSGVAAMGLSVALSGAVVIGLSGVIFAISGWAVLRDTHRTRMLGIVAWATLPLAVIYTFLTPHVSIGAHLGGLLAGLAAGYVFEREMRRGGIRGAPAASL
jgi:membrane associated rhomboid family serine protease